ncbi:peptidyl-prolyl cis-trans isomerase FKBP8 [Episyrphus balteatus]|uniref:peptidyl-prolyl cis-trans isomerase FKBP8 n=1 Tax=Episyrphus balteatus TaxID=286459 RepID=UPI00248504AC|nr:peptidyl-prolyl cis-trans isomerase FKBP8 [Episyrphus balteatus]
MDTEKSSNSSFEDLSNLNEAEMKQMKEEVAADEPKIDPYRIVDLLGNGQLIKKTLKTSDNPISPQRGELIKVSFTGKLDDGTIVENVENAFYHVGDFEVCQGLDMAIPMMLVGEVAEVSVDPRFAYGPIGLKNEEKPELSIPPDAKITYEVHLLDAKLEEHADLKTFEIRKNYGNRKKERANFWYNRNEFNIAIQLYRRALEYLDDRDGDPDANIDTEDLELSNGDLQSILDDRLVVYNNLAMAQIKISAYDAALASVEHVLRCQPNNHKALYRKGRILEGKGDTKGAISLLQKAATLEPDSRTIQQDLAKLIIKARREEHNEKEMYQKMLGHAKKLEQNSKQPLKRANPESSKLKVLGYLMGSILIGVAGVAMYRYKY